MTKDQVIKLIEDNGLTLHGDIEHFAHLVCERERQICCDILEALDSLTDHPYYGYGAKTIKQVREKTWTNT
jgi:hypothetical protein